MESVIEAILREGDALFQSHLKINNKVVSMLCEDEEIATLIRQLEEKVKHTYQYHYDIESFQEAHLPLSNANAKKAYSFRLAMESFPHIKIREISPLAALGLTYDPETHTITGTPTEAISTTLDIYFYCTTEPTPTEHIKQVPFIINPDPKDLWQNLPFDKESRFYKTEEAYWQGSFLDRQLIVASKRGRSHAHQGGSRDDDFYTLELPNEWAVIALADGAGSAKFARKGSEIATHYLCESFNDPVFISTIEQELHLYFTVEKPLEHKSVIINTIYRKIRELFHHLETFATTEEITLKDLHTTLIFALMKRTTSGYLLLTFGVGDCPICVLTPDETQVKLLNTLDIGEFGGGTRFITMPEIYSNEGALPIGKRFGIYQLRDFSKLFLMTDGIYDPKFVVENNLTKIECWKEFLADLGGNNEDNCKVDFDNPKASEQLLQWLDFWSKGNSDDRTLAIIY